MAMGTGHDGDAELARQRKRRRRLRCLVGVTTLVGLGAVLFCLWGRGTAPEGVTVVSLRRLSDSGARWIEISPAEKPRSVWFVAWGGPGPTIIGTAGPAGISAKGVTLPAAASGLFHIWDRDRVVYLGWGGAAHLWSPPWNAPRKLADAVEPRACGAPVWSPDGSRLALPLADSKYALRSVRIFSRDGEVVRDVRVPASGCSWGGALWAPSGQRLLLVRSGWVWQPAEQRQTFCMVDSVVLSEPDWRPVVVDPTRTTASPLAWADDSVLVGAGGRSESPELVFTRPLSGARVGSFDCGTVRVRGPRTVWRVPHAQAVRSGAGVVAECEAGNLARVGLWQAAAGLRGLPVEWRVRLHMASSRVQGWVPSRVAYVYVPLAGTRARTLAVADTETYPTWTISADGTELLYLENWDLKAAPLPAEARADPRRSARSQEE